MTAPIIIAERTRRRCWTVELCGVEVYRGDEIGAHAFAVRLAGALDDDGLTDSNTCIALHREAA